jgi:serine/threonine protein kinase/DNA-binding SARP family transcriptional activator
MHDSQGTPAESSIPLSLLERVDQAGDRFEDAWEVGSQPRIEIYLAESPEAERALFLRELLGLELVLRRRAGETPSPTEYLSRFPEHAAVIHEVFADTPAGAARPDRSEADSRATPPEPGDASGAEQPPDAASGPTPGPATTPETTAAAAGDWPVVPGYEILGALGKGGMGIVYRARHRGLERVVALKMIRAGTQAVPEELARFRTEAALQARVHHLNIVQIFEIGEVHGCPYFALECVDGPSLDKRIAGQPQPARAAAQLVETLARAVQHAHEKGLVHRDLKPSNILLTAEGTPKVGDFGLAKRLEGDAGQTQTGAVVGTPNYMAPEQAWGRLKAIGPATDVYALGTILYELLTGRPPFLGATPLDTIMQVRHQEPVPPRRWLASVPRDLETICLKCLQKEPAKRYGSALALAEDLKRFVSGEPIQARPSPIWEKALKWAKRKPAAAALIGVSGLALLTLFGVVLGFTLKLQAALHETEKRQRAAEANERKAEAVRAFLEQDLLRQADPGAQADALRQMGGGFEALENPTVKELLDRAAEGLTPEKIEAKFPQQPEVQASILRTVGDTYRDIGQYGKAVEFLARAMEAYQHAMGNDHPQTLLAGNSLALAYLGAGRTVDAVALFERVRDIQVRTLGADHPQTLLIRDNLAQAYLTLGRTAEAITLLEQVRDAEMEKLGADHSQTILTLDKLAWAYQETGRIAEAIALFEHVRDARMQRLGPDHPQTLHGLTHLATAYLRAGRTGQAIVLLEQVRDAEVKKLGAEHPQTLLTLNSLAQAYNLADKKTEAIALFKQVYDGCVRRLGPDHQFTLGTLNNLANTYRITGRVAEAIPLLKQVHDACVKQLGADHLHTLIALNNLAMAYRAAGNFAEAITWLEQVREAQLRTLGADHPFTLSTLNSLAMAYFLAGKREHALPLFQQAALGMEKRHFLDESAAEIVGNLSACHEWLKQYSEAETWRRKWLAVVKERPGPDSAAYASSLAALGSNLLHQHKYREAEPTLRECLAVRAKQQPDAWSTFNTKSLLGEALLGQQKFAEAEPLLKAGYGGLKAREKAIPPQAKSRLALALDRLVQLYDAWGKPEQAEHWRKQRTPQPAPTLIPK